MLAYTISYDGVPNNIRLRGLCDCVCDVLVSIIDSWIDNAQCILTAIVTYDDSQYQPSAVSEIIMPMINRIVRNAAGSIIATYNGIIIEKLDISL